MFKTIKVFISSRKVFTSEKEWFWGQIKQEKGINDEQKKSRNSEGKIIWGSGYLREKYHIQEVGEESDREEEGGQG